MTLSVRSGAPRALAVAVALAAGAGAEARCQPAQGEIAATLAANAAGVEDPLDRALALKRSLKVCESVPAWLELGRAELELGNLADARHAFENARDGVAPDGAGAFSRADVERRALAGAWLAETLSREGRLAPATVAVREARADYEALGAPAPARLVALQARLDDALAEADPEVLARTLSLQHERATRGIGLRPRIGETADPPEAVAANEALATAYAGESGASAAAGAAADAGAAGGAAGRPAVATGAPASADGATTATESRLDIPVLFEFDSAALAPAGAAAIDRLAGALGALGLGPADRVRVIGHTDVRGDAAYNLGLSERRAAAVLERLDSIGATAAATEAVGRGETEPRYAGDTPEDHRRNRRVELVVIR